MKIGWNVLNCGLGNNGGSRTVILCNETLNKMGHESVLISNMDLFTWFEHSEIKNSIPPGLDAIISTDANNIQSTLDYDVKNKFWYTRLFQPSVEYKKLSDLTIIANSINLQKRVLLAGAKQCEVIYQGIDFGYWEDLDVRDNGKIRIGCLFSSKPRKNWKEFVEIANSLDKDKFEFVAFGTEECKDDFICKSIKNPSTKELANLYGSCNIWIAPTLNEGLHNVPLEAALCGCLIMCGNHEGNGMLYDYAFPEKTAMVYNSVNEAVVMIENPNYSLIKPMQRYIHEHIGTRKAAMEKFIDVISN